jgi:AraC-like DNA-binding protein
MLSSVLVQNIIAVNRLNYTALRTIWHRDRQCYALTVKKEGRTIYQTLDRTRYVSDKNHILLLTKGITYSFTFEELGECIMVEFDGKMPDGIPGISSFGIEVNPAIADILDKMETEWTFKRTAYRNSCMSSLYQILAILERTEKANNIPLGYYKLIQPAVKYMAQKYMNQKLNNDILAKQANMSTSYFRRLFKKIFAVTPMRYLQDMRIEKVKELLLTERLSVSEAADMAGFSSLYYLDYVFKKIIGMTPTEYVKVYVNGSHNDKGQKS